MINFLKKHTSVIRQDISSRNCKLEEEVYVSTKYKHIEFTVKIIDTSMITAYYIIRGSFIQNQTHRVNSYKSHMCFPLCFIWSIFLIQQTRFESARFFHPPFPQNQANHISYIGTRRLDSNTPEMYTDKPFHHLSLSLDLQGRITMKKSEDPTPEQ